MNAEGLRALAREVVKRRLGEVPVAARQILTGHSNDIVKVDAVSGRSFVVRVSKLGTDRFDMEQAVMAMVADAGVPVPKVRFVGSSAEIGDAPAVMIADWVDAPSLDSIRDGSATAPLDLTATLASTLAAIHSCKVHGFGELDAHLQGAADDFVEWFVGGAIGKIERSIDVIARCAPEGKELPAKAAEVLARQAHVLTGVPRSLAHGDFSPSNLLVNATTVAAVIDWESAKGGPPALDFGWIAYIDIDSLMDGDRLMKRYAAITGCDLDELSAQSRLVELRILAASAEWQARAQLLGDVPATLHRLAERLHHLR